MSNNSSWGEGDRQVRAALGTQGVEESLTSKMTPVPGGSWGVTFREDSEGAAWRNEKIGSLWLRARTLESNLVLTPVPLRHS